MKILLKTNANPTLMNVINNYPKASPRRSTRTPTGNSSTGLDQESIEKMDSLARTVKGLALMGMPNNQEKEALRRLLAQEVVRLQDSVINTTAGDSSPEQWAELLHQARRTLVFAQYVRKQGVSVEIELVNELWKEVCQRNGFTKV